jgi:hypothetical protein
LSPEGKIIEIFSLQPKKQATNTTVMKIQSSLADTSKKIEKQSTQINKNRGDTNRNS